MDPTQLDIVQNWLLNYRYSILIPLTIVEGPLLMVLCGVLLKLGYYSFIPLFLTLAIGDLLADVMWYAVGRFGGLKFVRKYGQRFGITVEMVERAESRFRRHEGKLLFLSKITMGLGFAVAIIVAAGLLRVNFRKFLSINAVGQVFWTIILLGAGYFFGHYYENLDRGFRYASLASFLVLVYIGITLFKSYLQKKNLENQI